MVTSAHNPLAKTSHMDKLNILVQGCMLHVSRDRLLKVFIFIWRIIALQCCVGFCVRQHESAVQSSPSWTFLPSPTLSCPCRGPRALGWAPCTRQLTSYGLSILHMVVYVSVLRSHLVSWDSPMATLEMGRGEQWKRYAVHQEGLFLLQSWERSAFHFRGSCRPEAKESKADLPFLALTQYTHTRTCMHTQR